MSADIILMVSFGFVTIFSFLNVVLCLIFRIGKEELTEPAAWFCSTLGWGTALIVFCSKNV